MRSPINRYHVITLTLTGLFLGVPLWGQDLNFAPAKPDGPAKIQSALWELATPRAGKPIHDLQDTVVVILVPHRGQASASIDTSSMAALGVEVKARSKSLMRVSVPVASLLAVSELPGVSFVRRPFRPQAQQTAVFSEGGRDINAYSNYFAGVRGQGVKVAVIDGGFKGADELIPGNMPGFSWRNYTDEGIYDGEDVHGTACAEIIYDVAPEAELYLHKVDDLVDLENAKDRSIREGVDIINHSMGWFGTGIGDGRGIACDIVNDAADKGILWVNSAGNDAKSHYYGFWSDNDSDGWHNFKGEDETLAFEAEKGDEIRVFLTWNDWPSSRENYDLYLFSSSDGLERVAKSTDRQNGYGDLPVERIEYKVERSGEYGITVRSEDARPRRLKIWSLNHDFEEYSVAENSIGSPADARGAMSVGAVHYDFYDLGRIADYSSRGPTLDGRIKPELVAPTGVSTASYGEIDNRGRGGYHGTSAAAPHVAGAAALIKSANPSYTRDDLWDALIEATVDIGPRGRDNTFGNGKLVLPIIPQELPSTELLGYSPPAVTRNITTAKFGFEGSNRTLYCYFSVKEISAGEVDILLNEQWFNAVPASADGNWKRWYLPLNRSDLRSGRNTIEFRNTVNENYPESYAHWQLKDVSVTSRRPANAKPVPGTQLPSELPDELVSGLGAPFPTPFNASVTVPFTVADAGPVRISVYNLMGQSIRVLADGWTEAGLHQVRWDGRTAAGAEAASGVYWAVLQAGEAVQTVKLALIR